MLHKINPKWQAEMESKILQDSPIDTTQTFLPCIQWLIMKLSKYGVAYRLYNLGAGVKRVTTDTSTCPCCKQKLMSEVKK
ncbi:MAG: hypothetical protein ACYDG4_13370 [Desulfuromonadaceae bacterium]